MKGEVHRVSGPALEEADGNREWYQYGQLHRVGGPAVERADGNKLWYMNDQLHRVDGPAIELVDGTKGYWLNGVEYSEEDYWQQVDNSQHKMIDNLEMVASDDGSKFWYLNGKLHRVGGPAIERANGDKEWYQNGKKHRANGPAIDLANGDREWWVNGVEYNEDGSIYYCSEEKRLFIVL